MLCAKNVLRLHFAILTSSLGLLSCQGFRNFPDIKVFLELCFLCFFMAQFFIKGAEHAPPMAG